MHVPPMAVIVASSVAFGAGNTWALPALGTSMDLPISVAANIPPQVTILELTPVIIEQVVPGET